MSVVGYYRIQVSYQFTQPEHDCSSKLYGYKCSIVSLSEVGEEAEVDYIGGSTEGIEARGTARELLEFPDSIQVAHNYCVDERDNDATLRIQILKATTKKCGGAQLKEKMIAAESRRSFDSTSGVVRFRNLNDNLLWTHVDSVDCDLNALVHRGRFSDDDDDRRRTNSSGKFTVISECASYAESSQQNDTEIRMEVSVSQLEKRGKLKHTEMDAFLAIHRKSLTKEDYIIVYRSPTLTEMNSSSNVHKFPEIVISKERLLAGASDRLIRFTLRNAANGFTLGEAEVLYSQMINEGRVNLKLYLRDVNGNTLFGVSRRSVQQVGVVHVNAFLDCSTMSSSSRGSTASSSSSGPAPSTRLQQLSDEDDLKSRGNVMMASGRTQAYLISLLAPSIDVRLRQPLPHRSTDQFHDRNYYK